MATDILNKSKLTFVASLTDFDADLSRIDTDQLAKATLQFVCTQSIIPIQNHVAEFGAQKFVYFENSLLQDR